LRTITNTIKSISCAAALCLLLFAGCVDLVERTITIGDFTLTFDPLGGTEVETVRAAYGTTVILPETVRPDHTLLGWYDGLEQGERVGGIGDGYLVKNSVAMYARWMRDLVIDEPDSVINGIPVVRVLVGAGTFVMGSPESEEGRYFDETQREVTLSRAYWISKYPITNFQFGRTDLWGLENHPAVNVTWQEALDFAVSVGGTLPTEAQWEFAARGGNSGAAHIYSGSGVLDAVGWYEGNSGGGAQAVGQKQPNELGIHDMSGNVFEWCYDWYGFHTADAVTDPTGPQSGQGRVSRGGAWDRPARDGRVADRAYSDPNARSDNLGFRVVFFDGEVLAKLHN
jgi:hypothetical protein